MKYEISEYAFKFNFINSLLKPHKLKLIKAFMIQK